MRNFSFDRFLLLGCVASLCISFSGCGKDTAVTEPELGAIEAYLNEHPEERVDDPDDAQDEAAEFAAGNE